MPNVEAIDDAIEEYDVGLMDEAAKSEIEIVQDEGEDPVANDYSLDLLFSVNDADKSYENVEYLDFELLDESVKVEPLHLAMLHLSFDDNENDDNGKDDSDCVITAAYYAVMVEENNET